MPIESELHTTANELSPSRPPFAVAGAVADWFEAESTPSYLVHSARAMLDTAHRIEAELEV